MKYVIIGYDPLCQGLITQLAKKPGTTIILQTERDISLARRELFSGPDKNLKELVTLVNGSRISSEDLAELGIPECGGIFLLGEAGEKGRDSLNVECLGLINGLLAGTGIKIRCQVLFEREVTFTVFRQQDPGEIREHIDFVPFNFFNLWAQKVFADLRYSDTIRYLPLDREPITASSDKKVHLVILGMSGMGVALGMEAARICHFPNFITKGIKTRITFIDEYADREMNFLRGRLANFFDEVDFFFRDINGGTRFNNVNSKEKCTDIEMEFIKARFEQREIREYLREAAWEQDAFLTIAVTLSDSAQALAAGLYLPEEIYESETRILIRQESSFTLVDMLAREGAGYRKYKNVKPFGMIRFCLDMEGTSDLLPMMIKYVYDHAAVSAVTEFPEEEIRKNWLENWEAGDNVSALKASNRYCADFVGVKARSLDIRPGLELTEEQIGLAARMEHNRWVTEKLLLGFRPPTAKESAEIAADSAKRKYYKDRLVHEDIKAYEALGDQKGIDVKLYDINISRALPYMLKAYHAE
jgi:hypothetical protein